ncbi:hypothetical protein H0H81_012234 [Sphagnurus paluster]|uniref:Uncharacterized protein n=1 Tax=Sphagnurus paluster TaxID=117069 RepID=A0A9P7FWS4_9AGAR|nr:hypothetical protein H0H81_012234 [Sphagnurus paluster]
MTGILLRIKGHTATWTMTHPFVTSTSMYAPFSILTAFSGSFNGGNPAAVVFTDMNLPVDTFKTIAENLNQPITAFVSALPLPSNDSKSVTFDVRWFTSSRQEIALCGHGTLAAAKAVFDRDDVAEVMEVIKFQTLTRGIMQARRCRGGLFEIELPSASPVEVSPEERDRLLGLVTRTFGKEVAVDYIAYGGAGFELCKPLKSCLLILTGPPRPPDLLFVLDEKEDLQNLPVNAAPLVSIRI